MVKKFAFAVLLFVAFSGLYSALGQTKLAAPAERPAVAAGNASPTNEADLASVRQQLFRFRNKLARALRQEMVKMRVQR